MTGKARRVRVAEALPEILEHLDPGQQELARRQLVADLLVLKTGPWTPNVSISEPGHLGLLVLDGLLSRDVVLEKPLATELVGRGDLLRPTDRDGEDAPVPFGISWTVLHPARLAFLDPAASARAASGRPPWTRCSAAPAAEPIRWQSRWRSPICDGSTSACWCCCGTSPIAGAA